MKKLNLLILFCLSYSLIFAQSFEGTVKVHVEGTMVTIETISADGEVESEFRHEEQINQDILFQVKGNMTHFIMDDSGTKMTFITDKSTGDITQILEEDGERMVMQMNLKKRIEAEKNEEPDNKIISVTKTGKSKKIRGYFCDEYEVKFDGGSGTVWATKEIELDMEEQLPLPSDDGFFTVSFDKIDGFVMEMNNESDDGNKMYWTATVEKTVVDDSIFELNLTDEEQKRLDSQQKIKKILEQYEQAVKEAAGDAGKIKQLTEELTKQLQEYQN